MTCNEEWVKVDIVVFLVLEMVHGNSMVRGEDGQHQNSKRKTLLGVTVVVGRMCWAVVVTAGAGAKSFSSREFLMRTMMRLRSG